MLGQHIIVDFYGVNRDLLDDNEALAAIMQEAVAASGAHYLGHKFEPQSCSGVILIADSHLAWHTWPEHGFISLDYYTYSGGNVDGVRALDVIQERLEPSYGDHQILERGRFVPVPPNRSPEPEDNQQRPRLICIDGDVK